MTKFLNWFLASPTPIITILSILIAFLAYLYQRKWNRKQKSYDICKWYSQIAIPRFRFIKNIFELVGNDNFVNRFSLFNNFTSTELDENLKLVSCCREVFINNFNKINNDILKKAYIYSGCNSNIRNDYECLKEACNEDADKYKVLDKYIINFLNELETLSLQFNCNIAEEKMVYPILHQTFIRNMNSWYFFISKENHFDHNRYYPNIISLYLLWSQRASEYEKRYNNLVNKKTKSKKI